MDDQYTFENKTYRDTYRHTTSHILAQAMKRLYPEVKLAIGPAIEIMAANEYLDAHKNAITVRLTDKK